MMQVHRQIVSFTLLLIVLLCSRLGNQHVTAAYPFIQNRDSQASDIPDTPEESEVIAALEGAYAVLSVPFEDLDLKQLSEVLVNDPSYASQLSTDELTDLKEYTREVQGKAALEAFGYLTTMRTKRMNQQNGARLLRAAQEKAKSENREVSREEMQQLTEQNYGMEPYVPHQDAQQQSEPFKRVFRYFSLKIKGDTAEVYFDDMAKNRRAILIRVDGKWYVAGIF